MTGMMKRIVRPVRMGLYRLCMILVAASLFLADQSQTFSQETAQTEENAVPDPATGPTPVPPGEPELQPELRTLPPAYDGQMLRLAEALGALHYLRNLCGEKEGQTWREQMEALLAAEEPSAQRRAQLIANFNRGFRGYQEIYRECTIPATEAANQFLQQAMRLTAEIPNRFGR